MIRMVLPQSNMPGCLYAQIPRPSAYLLQPGPRHASAPTHHHHHAQRCPAASLTTTRTHHPHPCHALPRILQQRSANAGSVTP